MSGGWKSVPWAAQESQEVRRHPVAATLLASATLVAGAFVAPSAAVGAGNSVEAQQQSAAVRHLMAMLRGTESGDPNGAGHADFRLNRLRARVCADVTYRNIGSPHAAHIHRKSDGGVVVDLTGSVTGGAHCARGVSRPLIRRILEHPRRYYFNVHNDAYPAGAIQGTLHR